MSDELFFPDIVPILRRLEGVPLVLIGGQAVNFWADRYLGRAPELAEHAPFTSKDVDFCGTRKSVEAGAQKLRGRAILPEPFDPTPNAGVVVFLDSQGKERSLDILYAPLGLKWKEVWDRSVRVQVPDDAGLVSFRVLHPFWTMVSRTCNVRSLPKSGSMRQLSASLICLREFMREILDQGSDPALIRAVMKLHKRIFHFAIHHKDGRRIWVEKGAEPFDAAITDVRLPRAHNEENYPRMAVIVKRLRDRQKAQKQRVEASGKTLSAPAFHS